MCIYVYFIYIYLSHKIFFPSIFEYSSKNLVKYDFELRILYRLLIFCQ